MLSFYSVMASGLCENAAAATRGGEVIGHVVKTMDGIRSSSNKFGEITGAIDAIAFQTNILALNAAVEAARAGAQRRGFAVVATEVRTLAGRSASATREIKALITTSIEQVGNGNRIVAEAGATYGELVTNADRIARLMSEISTATREQSAGVGQVGAPSARSTARRGRTLRWWKRRRRRRAPCRGRSAGWRSKSASSS